MIEINLLPEEKRKTEAAKLSLPAIPVQKTLIILGAVFLTLQFLLSLYVVYRRLEVEGVKNQIAALTRKNKQTAFYKSEIQSTKKRLQQIQTFTERKFFWTLLLNAVSDSMTKGIWLGRISLTDGPAPPGSGSAEKDKAPPKAPSAKETQRPKSPVKPERVRWLRVEGSVVAPGQETAFIGRFIKELKQNRVLDDLLSSVELFNIDQRKIRDYDVYDFVLMGAFKKEKLAPPS